MSPKMFPWGAASPLFRLFPLLLVLGTNLYCVLTVHSTLNAAIHAAPNMFGSSSDPHRRLHQNDDRYRQVHNILDIIDSIDSGESHEKVLGDRLAPTRVETHGAHANLHIQISVAAPDRSPQPANNAPKVSLLAHDPYVDINKDLRLDHHKIAIDEKEVRDSLAFNRREWDKTLTPEQKGKLLRHARCDLMVKGVHMFNTHTLKSGGEGEEKGESISMCGAVERECGVESCESALDVVMLWVNGSDPDQV